MNSAGGVEHGLGFSLAVRLPHILYLQDGKHYTFRVSQSDFAGARRQRFCELFGDIQGDRYWPKCFVGEPHVVTDTLVIWTRQKPPQRRKTATHDKFQVAELARGQVP